MQRPVIDHWWQTETGWAIAANCMGLEPMLVNPDRPTNLYQAGTSSSWTKTTKRCRAGRSARSVSNCRFLRALSDPVEQRRTVCPSYLTDFPGYYMTADAGYMDEDGYVYIMARTDDVINVAGHRLSTGAMEEVLSRHQDVAECAVLGVADNQGPATVGFIVLKLGVTRATRRSSRKSCKWCGIRSGRSPHSRRRPSSIAFRKPAQARSCAARYRRSPTMNRGRCRQRSMIQPFSTRSSALEGIGYASARKEEALTGAQ